MTTIKKRDILSWRSGLPYDNTRFAVGMTPRGGQHGEEWYCEGSDAKVVNIDYVIPNPITETTGNYVIKLDDDRVICISEEVPAYIEEKGEGIWWSDE
ncbi:hypothetical protein OJ633_000510 [Listeria monocytogenes]|nr:hypothetical protein [Listeria monocytogenes]EKA2553118.1 hypothetical protein [Listeria monocytogenes]EKA2556276.1 hypothetical protein [Listeria monocytogenes]EKA2559400.1 hypothetical protein [Listeria monocytogenes]EKA2562568.1 hypothetical protein [Listeria monocytogenes]